MAERDSRCQALTGLLQSETVNKTLTEALQTALHLRHTSSLKKVCAAFCRSSLWSRGQATATASGRPGPKTQTSQLLQVRIVDEVYRRRVAAREAVTQQLSSAGMQQALQKVFPYPCQRRFTAITMLPESWLAGWMPGLGRPLTARSATVLALAAAASAAGAVAAVAAVTWLRGRSRQRLQ